MYYGLSLNGGNLAGNLLKNRVSLNGFDEVLRNITTKLYAWWKNISLQFAFKKNVYLGCSLLEPNAKKNCASLSVIVKTCALIYIFIDICSLLGYIKLFVREGNIWLKLYPII